MSHALTKLAPAAIVLIGSIGLGGCATKGFVREEIATVNQRIDALDTKLQTTDGTARQALAEAQAFAADHPGTLIEDKPFGVGLHYRGAPEAGAAMTTLAEQLATVHDLHLQHGKMVVELRMAGRDKGAAVELLMRDPLRQRTVPVFVGDDVTADAGFAAAAALGGAGVLVGPARDTAATYRVEGVADVLAWLDAACREKT